ncbi:ef hand domain-containing protein, partial [Cystoisospora suis]
MVLDSAFVEKCRQAFQALDTGHQGALDRVEMRDLLETILGKPPSDDIFFRLMAEIEEDCAGQIDFAEFIRAFEKQHSGSNQADDEQDTIDAWIALGGARDKSGELDTNKLIKIVKEDFQMTIDIGQLLDQLDINKDGKIDFKVRQKEKIFL